MVSTQSVVYLITALVLILSALGSGTVYWRRRDKHPINRRFPVLASVLVGGSIWFTLNSMVLFSFPAMPCFIMLFLQPLALSACVSACMGILLLFYSQLKITQSALTFINSDLKDKELSFFIAHRGKFNTKNVLYGVLAVILIYVFPNFVLLLTKPNLWTASNNSTACLASWDQMFPVLATLLAISFAAMAFVSINITKSQEKLYIMQEFNKLTFWTILHIIVVALEGRVQVMRRASAEFAYLPLLYASDALGVIVFEFVDLIFLSMAEERRRNLDTGLQSNDTFHRTPRTSQVVAAAAATTVVPKTKKGVKLEEVLANADGVAAFRDFLVSEYSVDHLIFLQRVDAFTRDMETKGVCAEMIDAAQGILKQFCYSNSPLSINISASARNELENISLSELPPDASLEKVFLNAYKEVYRLLAADSFLRFKTSKDFSKIRHLFVV